MDTDLPDKPANRRRGPDLFVRIAGALGGAGWLLLILALVCVGKAKPESANVFGYKVDIPAGTVIRITWDPAYMLYAFYLAMGALCLGVMAILFNLMRQRRKDDSILLSPILVTLSALAGVIKYLYFL